MNRNFGLEHYQALDPEARARVDQWLTDNNLMESGISLVEEVDDGTTIVLSGPSIDAIGLMSEAENEIKVTMENNFPWDLVENSLRGVVVPDNQ